MKLLSPLWVRTAIARRVLWDIELRDLLTPALQDDVVEGDNGWRADGRFIRGLRRGGFLGAHGRGRCLHGVGRGRRPASACEKERDRAQDCETAPHETTAYSATLGRPRREYRTLTARCMVRRYSNAHRSTPERIDAARHAATRARLMGDGVTEGTADAWIAAWAEQAARGGIARGERYWDDAWAWIADQRTRRVRP